MSDGYSVVVLGATGMIGGIALDLLLANDGVSRVTTLGRRATGREHPALTEITHADFTDFAAVAEALAGHDAALFCLGAYTGSVPDEVFREITVDYTVAFAEALHARSPDAAFVFLSGQGADPQEESRMAFARYKGAAENALLAKGFGRVHIFRPGYIYPVTRRREPNVGYRILRGLYPVMRWIYPNIGLRSDDLARAMVHAALEGLPDHPEPVLENRAIRKLAKRLA